MKKLTVIVFGMFLFGCGMTNEEIIAEDKECKDAGLQTFQTSSSIFGVLHMYCKPWKN